MFGFLGKLIGMGVKLFSKIKPAVQGAVKLFDKGKNIYSTVKNTVSNVPFVGSLAKDYINKGEEKLAELSKNAIGITPSDINQAVGVADRLTRPPG
jgi:hypothetical protein